MSSFSATEWGTHAEFAQLYESYLDAIYESQTSPALGTGRWKLIHSIATEMRTRQVRTVLDCAAGTGFPALDLDLADSLPRLLVHCTDADIEMLNVLANKTKALGIDLGRLTPPVGRELGAEAVGSLRVDWQDLSDIRRTYDYVMCRGNSLAYADTWSGNKSATSIDTIRSYLVSIASKVDSGGYLHVDAPWRLDLPREHYKPVATGAVSIWEQVSTESECRHWRVDFKLPQSQTMKFERFSTLLTIYDLQAILDDLLFEETEPFQLHGERSGFGVIIARKPR